MSEQPNEEDKRKSVRIKRPLMARYSYNLDNGSKLWDETFVRDISESGMQITTKKPLREKDAFIFLLKIPLRPQEWLELKGEVIDSKNLENVYGKSVEGAYITRILFIDLKEEDKKLICDYISWILSRGGE